MKYRRSWILATLVLVSCSPATREAPPDPNPIPDGALSIEVEGTRGATLHYAQPGEPGTFNPVAAQDTRSILATSLFTATLLEWDHSAQKAVPGVAESWEVSEDGLGVTLKLRSGLRFADGEPVEAQDVLFSLQQLTAEETRSPIKTALLFEGQTLVADSSSPDQIRIQLGTADAAFEYFLAQVPVLPEHVLTGLEGGIQSAWNLETEPDRMTGLGPFRIESHSPGNQTTYRRNPHYWKVDSEGRRLPYLDRLIVHYIPDVNNQVLRVQTGDLDLIDTALPPTSFQLLEESGAEVQVVDAGASSKLSLFWFNLNRPSPGGQTGASEEKSVWFEDLAFRRAVYAAIDLDEIVRLVFLGRATPASSLSPPSNQLWGTPAPAPVHGTSLARDILRTAGYTWKTEEGREVLYDSRGRLVRFEILTTPEESHSRMAAMIQEDLSRIGIQASLRQEEFRSIGSRVMGSRQYDSVLASFQLPVEPSDYSNFLGSNGQMHLWNPRQKNAATAWERQIDELMSQQRSNLDPMSRIQAFESIQNLMSDNLPVMPIVHWNALVASRSRVRNLRPSPVFPFALWNVWELYIEE